MGSLLGLGQDAARAAVPESVREALAESRRLFLGFQPDEAAGTLDRAGAELDSHGGPEEVVQL